MEFSCLAIYLLYIRSKIINLKKYNKDKCANTRIDTLYIASFIYNLMRFNFKASQYLLLFMK